MLCYRHSKNNLRIRSHWVINHRIDKIKIRKTKIIELPEVSHSITVICILPSMPLLAIDRNWVIITALIIIIYRIILVIIFHISIKII